MKDLSPLEATALRSTPKHLWNEVITLDLNGFIPVTGTVREIMTNAQQVSDDESAEYAECGAYSDPGAYGFDSEISWIVASMRIHEMFTHTCSLPPEESDDDDVPF